MLNPRASAQSKTTKYHRPKRVQLEGNTIPLLPSPVTHALCLAKPCSGNRPDHMRFRLSTDVREQIHVRLLCLRAAKRRKKEVL